MQGCYITLQLLQTVLQYNFPSPSKTAVSLQNVLKEAEVPQIQDYMFGEKECDGVHL